MDVGSDRVFVFTSDPLTGMPPLAPRVYLNTTADESPGQPGLSVIHISGVGPQCDIPMPTGQFQIETIAFEYGNLMAFTATFELSCTMAGPPLRGCVHYEP
jgi:hypothetical protein